MLNAIKNAQRAGLDRIQVPYSNLKLETAKVLKAEKYISGVTKGKAKANKSEVPVLELTMAYTKENDPAITEMKFFSKPSRHLYIGVDEIISVKGGFNTLLISTSQGMMSDKEAMKNKVGGEIIAGIN